MTITDNIYSTPELEIISLSSTGIVTTSGDEAPLDPYGVSDLNSSLSKTIE